MTAPLALLEMSPVTLLILGIIAVLLFGERLPEVARKIGKGLTDFQRGMREIEQELRSAVDSSTDAYSTSSYPSSTQEVPEDEEESTAPKFEPPTGN